ncbi:MAG TPA: hypothetical protein VHO90_12545 [Bacteroidales bacterium]|nr:hypothetical protein [Bacteroidales bacterium]
MKHLFFLFTFVNLTAAAQNLVSNSGFETYDVCPDNFTIRYQKELIPGWYLPSLGTADYFNICTKNQVGVPRNFMGYCYPQDGLAYAGLILFLEPNQQTNKKKQTNYREYLQTSFTHPLEKNKVYEISLYFSVATYSTYAINRIGTYISRRKVANRHTSGVLDYKPQISIDTSAIMSENNVWYHLTGRYTAQGGEKYLTIGNFYSDDQTQYELCNLSDMSAIKKLKVMSEQISYYYFDNVSVNEIKK